MKKLLTLLLAVLLLAGCAGNKSGTFNAFPVNTGNIVSKCVKPWA